MYLYCKVNEGRGEEERGEEERRRGEEERGEERRGGEEEKRRGEERGGEEERRRGGEERRDYNTFLAYSLCLSLMGMTRQWRGESHSGLRMNDESFASGLVKRREGRYDGRERERRRSSVVRDHTISQSNALQAGP